MKAEILKLYSAAQNSAGERVRIALNLKGVKYEYIPVSSMGFEEFKRMNPQGLMPAIEVDGQFIAQSSAILMFLEEQYPETSLLPEDPILRAQSRSFASLIASEIHPLTIKRVRKQLDDAAVQGWIEHWHKLGLQALETMLNQSKNQTRYCFGNAPGWAELHLIPQLANARRFDIALSQYPLLTAIEEDCIKLEAFQNARPENQPDFP